MRKFEKESETSDDVSQAFSNGSIENSLSLKCIYNSMVNIIP